MRREPVGVEAADVDAEEVAVDAEVTNRQQLIHHVRKVTRAGARCLNRKFRTSLFANTTGS